MKTTRSMTRTLGLLALSLFAAMASPEARADSMLPRYRLEDLGLASKYSFGSNPVVWFLSDGTVAGGSTSIASEELRYRKGEYLRADVWSSQGRLEEFVLKKDGSDVNLLPVMDPKITTFTNFASNGHALFYISPGNGDSSQFVYDTATGEKTFIPTLVGDDRYSVIGINRLDEMVGTGWIGGERKALYYSSIGSEAAFLSTLVDDLGQWKLRYATDINDSGEIVGWGYDYSKPLDEGPRVFKLVPVAPVPEPSTWLIFAACGIWALRKRLVA